ncbi:MAG TPA: 50S ribosomal protein L9 [Hydrogenophilus thermoluteolus]|nr:50S ribosomal protein L9 [Hydrogenophilus thermoluteolus]
MQVILLDKVPNLGNLGDVVTVKDGYARNYLIPQGKAKRATPENIAEFEARRAELERQTAERLAQAQALGSQIEGITLQIVRKAGVDGRLFGSVTHIDIADELNRMGFAVSKGQVLMPEGPIKAIGEVEIEIYLHADVRPKIHVAVLGE